MLTIDNFVFDTLKRVEDIKIGNCLDIRSYKKNRKILIEKLKDGFNLYEDGFYKEEFLQLTKDELKKILKNIEKKEFPRSNKLRFYVLDSKESSVCRANYREEIEQDDQEKIAISIEIPYEEFVLVKKIIEQFDAIIKNIEYINIIRMEIDMFEEEFDNFKKIFKDKLEIKIFKL
ncbi:MAG: hypothetical protein ACRC57_00075 [Sarcina sp.]